MLLSQPQTEIISTTNDEKIQVATITTTTTTTASESVSASTSNVESVESKVREVSTYFFVFKF
jgi:hypothetical protein